jgi:hypothetical protein
MNDRKRNTKLVIDLKESRTVLKNVIPLCKKVAPFLKK